MQRQHLLLMLLTLFSLALTACGQKGPLYLPEDAPSNSFTDTQS